MTETVFILTILYVLYVIYLVRTSCNEKDELGISADKSTSSGVKSTEKKAATKTVAKKKEPAAKAAAKKAVPAAKAAAIATEIPTASVRNPETGELVKLANSYQMTRRWIKEALVNEGLLDKVYKTKEIDDDANTKIIEAIVKLIAMKKYQ